MEVEAQIGDVIPTIATDLDKDGPGRMVSLEVLHSYRGDQRKLTRLSTGLGGGDCGFDFEVGKQYRVYAFKDEAGELSTNICSRTALLEKSRRNSAYLHGKRVAPTANNGVSTTTSKLCGRVFPTDATGSVDSQILLQHSGSSNIFSQRNCVQLRQPPVAGRGQDDVDEREPTLARVHSERGDEWLFCV